ncbi:OsmC family protein [Haloarcula japonica]|uniref:OsmC family protein n=1 Tax=Haloarcula japonica (strain ATCC 49778 / DSM 6131 / JCM 7785 / NBRC 101032 / NCIMB 13157 / TR-1) TaxID=1227453 RepID=M0LB72_HALJT|nr:OsmC family protein [Haloarcula japonica]EMA29674.1 OsmC family protein [Haloarcula japonica DSM 6131]
MADIEVESTCEEGYTVESVINGEWELIVDALSENGPSPNEVLAADYASCYIPALRVAADKYGHEDIGSVNVDVAAELDEDDDLESIDFHVEVEESLADEEQDIIELAEDICHVHSALQDELHAEITIESGV